MRMAARRSSALGNMRGLGVRSLAISCMLCDHAARLDVEAFRPTCKSCELGG